MTSTSYSVYSILSESDDPQIEVDWSPRQPHSARNSGADVRSKMSEDEEESSEDDRDKNWIGSRSRSGMETDENTNGNYHHDSDYRTPEEESRTPWEDQTEQEQPWHSEEVADTVPSATEEVAYGSVTHASTSSAASQPESTENESKLGAKEIEGFVSQEVKDELNSTPERNAYIEDVFDKVLTSHQFLQKTSDIFIEAEGVMFPVHRFILLHHSNHLGEQAYATESEFLLVGLPSSVFEAVYYWMYGMEMSLGSAVSCQELQQAAAWLGMTALAEEVNTARHTAKEPSSAPAMYMYARRFGLERLRQIAYHLMRDHLREAITSAEFLQLPFESVYRLLSDDLLLIDSETTVLEAALFWLAYNWDSRLEHAGRLVSAIRFELMSVPELLRVTDLLPPDSQYRKTAIILSQPICMERLLQAFREKMMVMDGCEEMCNRLLRMGVSRMEGQSSTSETDEEGPVRRLSQSLLGRRRRRRQSPGRGKRRVPNRISGFTIAAEHLESHEETDQWETAWVQTQLNNEEARGLRRWAVFQSLRDRRFQELTCEVEFLVETEIYPVHRFLLIYHAPDLASATRKGRPESKTQVKLKGVPNDAFSVIYNWMYADHIDVGFEDRRRLKAELRKIQYYANEIGFTDFALRCYLYEKDLIHWLQYQDLPSGTTLRVKKSKERHLHAKRRGISHRRDLKVRRAKKRAHRHRLNQAATVIQKTYRGYRTRNRISGYQKAAAKIQSAYRGYKQRDTIRGYQKAATKIQSAYRGYKQRDTLKRQYHSVLNIQNMFNNVRRGKPFTKAFRHRHEKYGMKKPSKHIKRRQKRKRKVEETRSVSDYPSTDLEDQRVLTTITESPTEFTTTSESPTEAGYGFTTITEWSTEKAEYEPTTTSESFVEHTESEMPSSTQVAETSHDQLTTDESVERWHIELPTTTEGTFYSITSTTDEWHEVPARKPARLEAIPEEEEEWERRAREVTKEFVRMKPVRSWKHVSSQEQTQEVETEDSEFTHVVEDTGSSVITTTEFSENEAKRLQIHDESVTEMSTEDDKQATEQDMEETRLHRTIMSEYDARDRTEHEGYDWGKRRDLHESETFGWKMHDRQVMQESREAYVLLLGGRTIDRRARGKEAAQSPIMRLSLKRPKWKKVGHMAESRKYSAAVSTSDGSVYLSGGRVSISTRKPSLRATNSVLSYDFRGWRELPSMQRARVHHAMVLIEDILYVVGGTDEHERLLDSIESYSLKQGSHGEWTELTPLPEPRLAAASCHYRGQLWIAGGIILSSIGQVIADTVLIYSPENDSWYKTEPLREPKAFATLVAYEDRLYLIGGAVATSIAYETADLESTAAIDVYEGPETNGWRIETAMECPRHCAGAGILENYLIIIGGQRLPDKKVLKTIECYHLAQRHWVDLPIPPLPIPISGMCFVFQAFLESTMDSSIDAMSELEWSDTFEMAGAKVHDICIATEKKVVGPHQQSRQRQIWKERTIYAIPGTVHEDVLRSLTSLSSEFTTTDSVEQDSGD